MLSDFKEKNFVRLFEQFCIILFFVISIFILFNNSLKTSIEEISNIDAHIDVYAYNMPNRGWAPLTVFFSPFGTIDPNGKIVKYEWDLDGNGTFETDATNNDGYANYLYTKPRDYTITLRVTNDKGATATASTQVHVIHPSASSVDYETIFDDSRVRRIDLELSQSNWNKMMGNPGAKLQVEADASIFGEVVESIGLSPKGNSTIGIPGDKKPFKIDLNAYVDDQEYRNLNMLLLHNNFGDSSMLKEKMAYDMMQFAGVPGSHTAFVEVWLDITDDDEPSSFVGVYTMVERPDKKYLANRFGRENDTGNLYKADAWFEEGAADLAYYGEDINDYPMPRGELAYRLMYKENGTYSDIINLCYIIDGVDYDSPEDFAAELEEVFNVDSYLRYLSVIFLTLNFDQYPDTGNNYYIYNNPGTGKFEWISWDMGNSWGGFGGDYSYPIFGNENSIGPLADRPLFTNVFEVEEYQQTYKAYLDLLIRNYFNEENIGLIANDLKKLITPYLIQSTGEPMFFGENTQNSLAIFNESIQDLITLTKNRASYVNQVLQQNQE